MDPILKLNLHDGDLLPNLSMYKRLIGRLIYLTISRPDITFVVNRLSQYIKEPRVPHLHVVHHLLQYLKSAPRQGLFFPTQNSLKLITFADVDWASYVDTSEVVWLKQLLLHFEIDVPSAMLFCDNKSTISLATNPSHHERSKHIDIDYHFIREFVQSKVIKLVHVKNQQQVTDVFTKALSDSTFDKFIVKLKMINTYLLT